MKLPTTGDSADLDGEAIGIKLTNIAADVCDSTTDCWLVSVEHKSGGKCKAGSARTTRQQWGGGRCGRSGLEAATWKTIHYLEKYTDSNDISNATRRRPA